MLAHGLGQQYNSKAVNRDMKRMQFWKGINTERDFKYIRESFSKICCPGVWMWCASVFFLPSLGLKTERDDAFLSLPSYSPITPPAKTIK